MMLNSPRLITEPCDVIESPRERIVTSAQVYYIGGQSKVDCKSDLRIQRESITIIVDGFDSDEEKS